MFTLIIYDITDGLKNVYFNTVERKKERNRIDNWDKNFKMEDGKIKYDVAILCFLFLIIILFISLFTKLDIEN